MKRKSLSTGLKEGRKLVIQISLGEASKQRENTELEDISTDIREFLFVWSSHVSPGIVGNDVGNELMKREPLGTFFGSRTDLSH